MLVYRICNKEEITNILNNQSFTNIGNRFKVDIKKNHHKYNENIKYMHFFNDYDSVFYLNVTNGYYICTYDIPEDLLEKYKGIGLYLDRIQLIIKECVIEYAIPNTEIKFSYLTKIEKINEYIDFDDFVNNEYNLTTIYEKEFQPKTLTLTKKNTKISS